MDTSPSISVLDKAIRAAITGKCLLKLEYKRKIRVVEPHDYGIHKGSTKLLAYQVGGVSSGPIPNWRWFEVRGIAALELLNERFRGGRPGPSGKHHQWETLYARVASADQG